MHTGNTNQHLAFSALTNRLVGDICGGCDLSTRTSKLRPTRYVSVQRFSAMSVLPFGAMSQMTTTREALRQYLFLDYYQCQGAEIFAKLNDRQTQGCTWDVSLLKVLRQATHILSPNVHFESKRARTRFPSKSG